MTMPASPLNRSYFLVPSLLLLSLPSTIGSSSVIFCSQASNNDVACARADNVTFGLSVAIPLLFPFVFFLVINWKDFMLPGHEPTFRFGRRNGGTGSAGGAAPPSTRNDATVEISNVGAGYSATSTTEEHGEVGDTFRIASAGTSKKVMGVTDNFAEGSLISFVPEDAKSLNFVKCQGNILKVTQGAGGDWGFWGRGMGTELYLSVFGGDPSNGALLVLTDIDHAGKFAIHRTPSGKNTIRCISPSGVAWFVGKGAQEGYATISRTPGEYEIEKVATQTVGYSLSERLGAAGGKRL